MLLFQTPVDSAYSICVKFLHRSKAVNQQRQRHHRFFLKHTSELKNKLRLSLRNPFVRFVQLCSLSEQSAPIKCYSPHSAVNLCKWFFFFFKKFANFFHQHFLTPAPLCNSSSNASSAINSKQRKTAGDGEIFSPIQIFMKFWSGVNAQRWINLTTISFSGRVLLNVTFLHFFHSAPVLHTHSESWLEMVELRFLRNPEKMDNTLRLFFLLRDWAWCRDDNWLKVKSREINRMSKLKHWVRG